jgi:enoyl reductase-like protein
MPLRGGDGLRGLMFLLPALNPLTSRHAVDYLVPSGSGPNAEPKVTQLDLKYKYSPETPWAPIHEVVEDRIDRIKRYYWNVWDLGTEVNWILFTSSLTRTSYTDDVL